MHILLLSTGFPTVYAPLDGIFYRDQAEALAKNNVKTGFLAINPVSLISLLNKGPQYLGTRIYVHNEVDVFLKTYLNPPKRPHYCIDYTVENGISLFEEYTKRLGLPTLIHLHSYHAGLLAIKILETYNIPYVITEHSSNFIKQDLSNYQRDIAERVFKKSSHNMAVSKSFAVLLQESFNVPFEEVPNIVNTDFFYPGQKKSKEFVFINIASLDYNKNQVLLISSFCSAFGMDDPVTLRIVGSGINYSMLKKMIKGLNRDHQIKLFGGLSREDVKKQMR